MRRADLLESDDERGFIVHAEDDRGFVNVDVAENNRGPPTAQPGVALAVEQRPYGAGGELIHVSTRLIENNQVFEGVLASNGALLNNWAGRQRKIVRSDADITALHPNGDDVHMGDDGYLLTEPDMQDIVDLAAYGLPGLGA